jgi:hypothetical protein
VRAPAQTALPMVFAAGGLFSIAAAILFLGWLSRSRDH